MARTRTKQSIETEILELEAKIKKHQDSIDVLTNKKEQMYESMRQFQEKELCSFLDCHNMQINDALAILKKSIE